MPITRKSLMRGILYEKWENNITPNDIYQSQEKLVNQMIIEGDKLYAIIIEIDTPSTIPTINIIKQIAQRVSNRVEFFLVNAMLFKANIHAIVECNSNLQIIIYADLDTAIDAAQTLIKSDINKL